MRKFIVHLTIMKQGERWSHTHCVEARSKLVAESKARDKARKDFNLGHDEILEVRTVERS